MGACNSKIALEWHEPNASSGSSWFPETSPWYTQGSWSIGCKDNLGMLANVRENINTGLRNIVNWIHTDYSLIYSCYFPSEPNLRPSFAQLTVALKPLQRLVIPAHMDQPSSLLPQEISVNSTPWKVSVMSIVNKETFCFLHLSEDSIEMLKTEEKREKV